MSSISILPNPKAYANGNFNKLQCYAFQDLTNPVAGNTLISDALGNFTSQPISTGGVDTVTGTGPAIVINGTASAPNVVATGNFTGVALSTTAGLSVQGGSSTDTQTIVSALTIGPSAVIRYNSGAPVGSVLTETVASGTLQLVAPVTSNSMTQNLVAQLTLTDGTPQSGCSIFVPSAGTYVTSWSANTLVVAGAKVEARIISAGGFATFTGGQSGGAGNASGGVQICDFSNSGIAVLVNPDTLSLSFLSSGSGGGHTLVNNVTSPSSFPGATALTLIRIL